MSNPPQEMHDNFDLALEKVRQNLGKEYPMIINGEKRFAKEKHQSFSPIDTSLHLATVRKAPLPARGLASNPLAAGKALVQLERMRWLLLPALIHARTVA